MIWKGGFYRYTFKRFKSVVSYKPPNLVPIRSSPNLVDINVKDNILLIKLTNPKRLNVLSLPIVNDIKNNLLVAKNNPNIRAVIISSEGKYFCAGGDIVSLYNEAVPIRGMKPLVTPESMNLRRKFFREEYTMNYLTSCLGKPILSLIDGHIMGGGVGLVTHGMFSLYNMDHLLSMPECSIGFFPDVGSGHFLGKIDNNIGMLLGLSGYAITGIDATYYGIVTNYTKSEFRGIEEITTFLSKLVDNLEFSLRMFMMAKSSLTSMHYPRLTENVPYLCEQAFRYNSVEEIMKKCYDLGTKAMNFDLLIEVYKKMLNASPTSLKVTHRHLLNSKNLSLAECLKYEYRIAMNFMRHPDFYEGVRAKMIDKDNKPKWTPYLLDDVTEKDVDKFFELPDGEEDLDVEKELELCKND